ncbi:hypothetical protein F0185_15715 [Massilia sp. CCM 8692]|uniref:DUF2591 domain-containing protein n=1 Tax=Massilia rubra TaxID=2607910 RepID=A0ABX0LL25_9BURK|nr:hypothetical protein [Massilia rubra]
MQVMGYDFHITRRQFWADEHGPAISLAEWLDYASGDSEIEPDHENPGSENWLVVSHAEKWPLWWELGEVYTKNPDPAVIRKMISIARALDARVQDDDGEIHSEDSFDPADAVRGRSI